jgi:membrane protein involved in colicin uptake
MALANGSSGPTPADAKARHHAVRHHAPRAHRSQAAEPQAADTDNVQEGDQTAPDTGKGAEPKSSEGESTAEPAGDTTRDTATSGGAHECPPSCDPGETP